MFNPPRTTDETLARLNSPQVDYSLIRTVEINGESFDIGSDWHLPLHTDLPAAAARHIGQLRASDVFICVGDLNATSHGEDSSAWINAFLAEAASIYSLVIFVPGNHDLRGRTNPWESFKLPEGVVMPEQFKPLTISTENNRLLVGNIFYDMQFVNPALLDLSNQQLLDFYKTLTDGTHLLNGDLSHFSKMTEAVAQALNDDVDVLVTHALPHPALVTFRVEERTEAILDLESRLGVPFKCDIEDDTKRGSKHGVSPQDYRTFWNLKSFFMGSDLLSHPDSHFKDGLVCVYGHNHRGNRLDAEILGRSVTFLTHQPQ